MAAYLFMYEGKKPSWKTTVPTQWSLCIEAILAMYRGDLEACGKLFDASLKLHNKTAANKNLFENPLLDFFLILYYTKANTPATIKKANQFLNKAVTNDADYYPCRILIKPMI